jgi:hypothetical protein
MMQSYFREQWMKNKGLDSFSQIMSRTKSVDVSSKDMGGKSELVEENHNLVQQPLCPEDKTAKWVKTVTQYPNVRIRDKIAFLQARMNTPGFKLMRWVKLTRKKGIPYFEDPPILEAIPIHSIDYKPLPMLIHPPKDMFMQGKIWTDDLQWDLASR